MKIAQLVLSGAFILTATLTCAGGEQRPNILVILADDHCQAAISAYGSRVISTPNIDRLGQEGMRFNHAVATNSLCSPSRAVLLTGKYSHKNGVKSNGDVFDGSQQTFPKLLQSAGYETALVGKWHLVSQPQGFDYYSVLPGHGRYFDCRMKETGKAWQDGNRGGIVKAGYLTDVITDESLAWLKQRDSEKPFCLLVHHKAPHSPHDPAPRHTDLYAGEKLPEPPTLLDDYAGRAPQQIAETLTSSRMAICRYPQYEEDAKKFHGDRDKATRYMYETYMKGYLRLVASLDENVGRILAFLDESGLADKTVVVYVSDNGFFTGEHGFFNKQWMYEPSLHVPLIVRYPGVVEAESTNGSLVSMLDLAPTLLDLAGVAVPADMQGLSMSPLLSGKETSWRSAVYYHCYGKFNIPETLGVRTEGHKLIYYPSLNTWELFDLDRDPSEMQNLYGDSQYAPKQKELMDTLASLQEYFDDEAYQQMSGRTAPIAFGVFVTVLLFSVWLLRRVATKRR